MMIDPFDYKEPSCALCGGEAFYYPDADAPKGRVPIDRIIAKLDGYFEKNDLSDPVRSNSITHLCQRSARVCAAPAGIRLGEHAGVGCYRKHP